MRPGDTIKLLFTVESTAGVAQTGLLDAAFTKTLYLNGAANAATMSVAEIASGRYALSVTLPSTAGMVSIYVTHATHVVWPGQWEGEIESADLDLVYSVASVAVVTANATGAPGVETPLTFDAYRYHTCSATRNDQAGNALNMSGYNNPRFSVWTRDHSGVRYTLSTGITLGVDGTITWNVPEDASFFSNIDAAITDSSDTVTLYYDLVADEAATLAKTVTLLRGPLTLRRYESAA